MAQRPDEKNISEKKQEKNLLKVFTGREASAELYPALMDSLRGARAIDLCVSFLMESGVKMILGELKSAVERGAAIRILCGNYLGITQPAALYLLKNALGEAADLRFFAKAGRSFHPKAYFFSYERPEDHDEVFVGSSNLSRSALTDGIEWNYRITSGTDPESLQAFRKEFEHLFAQEAVVIDDDLLRSYARNWKRPRVYRDLEENEADQAGVEGQTSSDQQVAETDRPYGVSERLKPRGPQVEALIELENSRKQGAARALVQAATGVGKTYLAAFDSRPYQRVLFVAHREEILRQAEESFKKVRPEDSTGFFSQREKNTTADLIFASVQTLGKETYLESYFKPDDFDYIVIDEFHHAVTDNYRRIVDYFAPRFLLGLTATPERMDGRNIYEICDYNVPYTIDLEHAIDRGILAPFRYYGIYDKTDYSRLPRSLGHYRPSGLNDAYLGNEARFDLIYRYYRKYPSRRALGFCATRQHAVAMAKYFCDHGVRAAALVSGSLQEPCLPREEALEALSDGSISVLFSVDMLNEGVDVPAIDMVLFLRPTESPVVFLQQLGRGLRKSPGKEYLTVLDFLGNYQNVEKIPRLLGHSRSAAMEGTAPALILPRDCQADFDLELIDLFRHLRLRGEKKGDRIRREIAAVRDRLGHLPSRTELFLYMDEEIYDLCLRNPKENPFRDYGKFLREASLADDPFEDRPQSAAFIHLLETTSMSRIYKLPVLLAFLERDQLLREVSEHRLLAIWKRFFASGENWRDLPGVKSYEEFQKITDRKHLQNILRNPVHFLIRSGDGFFEKGEMGPIALSKTKLPDLSDPELVFQAADVIEYRKLDYLKRRLREKEDPEDRSKHDET